MIDIKNKGLKKYKFIDLFAGIGGFHLALSSFGAECVFVTEIIYQDSLNPWIDGDLWDKCKGEYCKKNDITITLDDTKGYAKYFSTPFVHFISIVSEKN